MPKMILTNSPSKKVATTEKVPFYAVLCIKISSPSSPSKSRVFTGKNSYVDMHYKLSLTQPMTSWRQSSLSVVTILIMYATSYHPRDVGLIRSLLSIGCLFFEGYVVSFVIKLDTK